MDAIEFLKKPWNINCRIEVKKRQIASIRESLSISAPAIDADQVMGGIAGEKVSDKILYVVELESDITKLYAELADAKFQISRAIDKMSDVENIRTLSLKYIELLSIDEIAETECVEVRTIQRRLKDAVDEFQQVYIEETAPG